MQQEQLANHLATHGPNNIMGLRSLLFRQLSTCIALALLLMVILAALSLASWNIADPSLNTANDGQVTNLLGFWGAAWADLMMQFLGLGTVVGLLPPFFWAILLLGKSSPPFSFKRLLSWPISALFFCGALTILSAPPSWPLSSGFGGIIGDKMWELCQFFLSFIPLPYAISTSFHKALTFILMAPSGLWFALYAGGVVMKRRHPHNRRKSLKQQQNAQKEPNRGGWSGVLIGQMLHFFMWGMGILRRITRQQQGTAERCEPSFDTNHASMNSKQKHKKRNLASPEQSATSNLDEFDLPYLDYLSKPKIQMRDETLSREALEQNSKQLAHILEDFGVKGEIINVRPGPVVTLYEFEPAPGIKSSRIIGLADDIARSMSAISARIAVIAGRNAIGIELPNKKRQMVYLREIFESDSFSTSPAKLALALGKTIGGEVVIADIAKMPHVLVAGTTGSGKSVAINTMIMSLVYRMTPAQCRLIMVDPKMLELSIYDGIPHLLTPVVTDPKKAIIALKWAVREMENRYRKMAKIGVRNIDGFNQRVIQADEKQETLSRTVQTGFDKQTGEPIFETEIFDYTPMPYIVVIIDEMADLMLVAGKDIEAAVQRLAQMARAAGIHVIMATQRPSVDVITGTIKANFPTRISFAVTSKIDSRTILGEQGAEQLLGQGDMLFMMGGGRMSRVHGPFIGDEEVEKIVAHLKLQGAPDYLEAVMEEVAEDGTSQEEADGQNNSDDPYAQAVAVVLRDRKASTSYIQRRLGIGYNRAASIIERMEMEGIISPPNHAGKRDILIEDSQEDVWP